MILYPGNDALFQRVASGGSHFCLCNFVNCLYNCVLVCNSQNLTERLFKYGEWKELRFCFSE